MLSLLNLIIASGTVLRSDTERWAPESYPDPRVNFTQCNVPEPSTLCDPDHILTDNWRETIHINVLKQCQRLAESPILYTDTAPSECYSNETQPVQIFVLLAKRIHTTHNQTVNETDMTQFVDGLADSFELANLTCKNFVLLVGVEQANAYVRTGRDLKLPTDFVEGLSKYTNLFNEKTYMEGLNKVLDEIGEQMITFFNPTTTEAVVETTEEAVDETTPMEEIPPEVPQADAIPAEVKKVGDKIEIRIPIWVFVVISSCIVIFLILCATASFLIHQNGIARIGAHIQRFVESTENRGFDDSSLQSASTKLDNSSFKSMSPYTSEKDITSTGKMISDLHRDSGKMSHGDDEAEEAGCDRSSGRSDNESCELNITTDESDDEREIITNEIPRMHLKPSELSTDCIVSFSPPSSANQQPTRPFSPSSIV